MSYTFITRALYSCFGCVKIALPETHNPTLIYIFFYVIFLSFLFTHAWQAFMHEMSYTFITRALYPTSSCVKIALPETHNPTLIYIFFYVIFLSFLFTHAWQAFMHEMSYTFITRALYPTSSCVKIALPETHNPTLIYIFFYVIFLSFLFTHAWQASMHEMS